MTDFKKLMTARFFFNFAVRMQAVIVGWRMYELTKDPLQLGLIGLAEALPALSIAIYAGYLVDRSRPLTIYRGVQWGSLLSAIVVVTSQITFGAREQVLALYVASFLTGAARGFSQPAMYAIVPRLMARAEISKASAWLSSMMQLASVFGPAVGGMMFAWQGSTVASVLPVLCLMTSLSVLALIRVVVEPPARLVSGQSIRDELFSGAAFVWKHPILLPALSLDMISVLFGGVTALLPIYAADVLQIGSMGLGFLRAGPAVGAMITSVLLLYFDMRAQAGRWLFSAVSGFGVCILVFGVSRNYALSFAALTFSGAFDGISVVIRSSAVQLVSPDNMRGKISAINAIFIGSSNELGEFESGVAARFLGTVPAVVFGGVTCLLTVAVLAVRSKELRGLDLKRLEKAS